MKNNQPLKAKALAQLLFEEVEDQDSLLNKYLEKLEEKFSLENQGKVDEKKLQAYLTENLQKLNERILNHG